MSDLLNRRTGNQKRIILVVAACIGILIVALITFLGYSLYQSYRLQSSQQVQQRIFGARLAAAAVAAELNSIRVFGTWYSESPRVRTLVRDENWTALSKDMDRVLGRLPSVVRIFASDSAGRLWADSPRKPDVHGVDFSYRDWFRGVKARQGVYLSHAYRRAAKPRIQVAAMAFPVADDQNGIAGVVVFQLSLDTILSWAANASLDSGGRLAFIDHHERSFEIDGDTGQVAMSETPVDRPQLRGSATGTGARGVAVRNNGGPVVVYAAVPEWGWGVYIEQSPETFFAGRDQELRSIILAVGLIGALCLAAAATAFVLLRVLARKERELARANADLVSANRNLRDFTHAVSHDLRAPLRAMSGFAEALVEDQGANLDPQSRHYLERIKAGSHKLGRMIEDLLAVARIPQAELDLRDVDLSGVARSIVEELQAAEPSRRVDVRIQPDVRVRGDPTLLALVLRNLLQNAWKFTRDRDPATIELGCERAPDGTTYYVADNGVGFDPEYAHKLFAMFQRLHGEKEFEGSGIGLAAALQAIERHGGRLWAEGREGEGAVFRFTVPTGGTTASGS